MSATTAVAPPAGGPKAWLLATRPKTLVATAVPIACGTALARALTGATDLRLLAWALASTFCLQIATNFINDAMDFKRGTDTAHRLGPTRASSAGLLDADRVYRAGLVLLLAAFALGLPLVAERGWPILAIGVASIVASWAYTGGPFPLAYHGLGDVFVFVFFGLVATAGSFFVQTGEFSLAAAVLGAQTGGLSVALIAINNLRDVDEDRANRKRTLAVLLGKRAARIEIALALVVPLLAGAYWLDVKPAMAWLPALLVAPLAFTIAARVARAEPGREYNRFLALTAAANLLFAIGFISGALL